MGLFHNMSSRVEWGEGVETSHHFKYRETDNQSLSPLSLT